MTQWWASLHFMLSLLEEDPSADSGFQRVTRCNHKLNLVAGRGNQMPNEVPLSLRHAISEHPSSPLPTMLSQSLLSLVLANMTHSLYDPMHRTQTAGPNYHPIARATLKVTSKANFKDQPLKHMSSVRL